MDTRSNIRFATSEAQKLIHEKKLKKKSILLIFLTFAGRLIADFYVRNGRLDL